MFVCDLSRESLAFFRQQNRVDHNETSDGEDKQHMMKGRTQITVTDIDTMTVAVKSMGHWGINFCRTFIYSLALISDLAGCNLAQALLDPPQALLR